MMLTIAHYCEKHKKKIELLYDYQTEKEGIINLYCPRCEGGVRKLKVEKK